MAKTKKTDDPEHSQAYYVLQAAQAKEELQRNGDANSRNPRHLDTIEGV